MRSGLLELSPHSDGLSAKGGRVKTETKAARMSGKKVIDPDHCTGCGATEDLAFVFTGKRRMPLRCVDCRRVK